MKFFEDLDEVIWIFYLLDQIFELLLDALPPELFFAASHPSLILVHIYICTLLFIEFSTIYHKFFSVFSLLNLYQMAILTFARKIRCRFSI